MKGSIYSIRSHKTTDVYIGSTSQQLCKRMTDHRKSYKHYLKTNNNYYYAFDILKYDDAYIELIEEIEYENKQELTAKEGHYIRNMMCINKRIEGQTRKEYYDKYNLEHREEHYNYKKEHNSNKKYYEKNKDQINKQIICECGGKYTHCHKSIHLKTQKHIRFINLI
jgi:hypothetical protein